MGLAPGVAREPFRRLFTQGMIRMDGKKMSKSKGNLIAPTKYFDTVGADALRLFHLFAGPPGDDMDWSDQTEEIIEGCARFLDRVWRLTVEGPDDGPSRQGEPSEADIAVTRSTHRLIAKVSDDIERWSFNTSVAACMEFANELQRYRRDASGSAPGHLRCSRRRASVAAGTHDAARHGRGVGATPWSRRHGSTPGRGRP